MEPARRHYGGEQHFHRTYSDQGALATHMDPHLDPRTFADYQVPEQFELLTLPSSPRSTTSSSA